jgi:hypothetical protein
MRLLMMRTKFEEGDEGIKESLQSYAGRIPADLPVAYHFGLLHWHEQPPKKKLNQNGRGRNRIIMTGGWCWEGFL